MLYYSSVFAQTLTNYPGQRRSKVVVVVGTTGAGKSKLAIDIAKEMNGECINADAMQVYYCIDYRDPL